MFKENQKERHKKLMKKKVEEGTHNFQNPELRKKINEISKKRWIEDNPMWKPEIIAKFKGPQKRIECPHCGKVGGKSAMKRYHFDNCKKGN